MRIVPAVLIAACALAACDGGGGSPDDVRGVVAALEDGGIRCDDLEVTDRFGSETDADVTERGLCAVDGQPVAISVFADAGARRRWVSSATGSGPVAFGDEWAVSSDSPDLLEEVADALDGTIAEPQDNEEES